MRKRFCLIIACITLVIASGFPALFASAESNSEWNDAVLIENENLGNANNPAVAMDDDGNAVLVWHQYNGSGWNVWASLFEAGKGWTNPEVIRYTGGSSYGVEVALDGFGNAAAVWQELNQTTWRYDVLANRYEAGIGWGGPVYLETNDTYDAEMPDIAGDSSSNFIAVWSQYDGSVYNAMTSRYEIGTGWSTASSIETNNTAYARFMRIGTDANGNAIAVWRQSLGPDSTVWANRYVDGAGWGAAEQIGSLCANGAPKLAVAPNGDATCVWQHMNIYYEVWGTHYSTGTGWETDALLKANPVENIVDPEVATDANGDSIVVWWESGGFTLDIWEMHYDSGSGWGSASIIAYSPSGNVGLPEISMNNQGIAALVFGHDFNSVQSIWGMMYYPDIGWSIPERINSDSFGSCGGHQVFMSDKGDAIAVWSQNDGQNYNIWANHYFGPDDIPPNLSIDSPIDNTIIETPVITVSGTTEPGATLEVNGLIIAVETDGSFSFELALNEGSNTITANATDDAGNSIELSVIVTYDNPLPGMEDELTNTTDELNATINELNATQNDLQSTQDQLTDAESEIDKLNTWLLVSISGLIVAVIAIILAFIALMLSKKGRGGKSGSS